MSRSGYWSLAAPATIRRTMSTSTGLAASAGLSAGSNVVAQNSGVPGSSSSARKRSCACATVCSAMMTFSSFEATSASAWTMSMGAIVPTSTRLRLSPRVWRDSSSVCCCTARFDSATARLQ